MSGHSKWSTIKRKKGAADAKRGKLFTKIIREVTVAAREGGGEPDANPRLRSAIAIAKAANMPAANIERAVKKGAGNDPDTQYEEVSYEGYAPGGVAIFIECLTDNRNRTGPEVRHLITKRGGSMGRTGTAAAAFNRRGRIVVPSEALDFDIVFEAALEAGARRAGHGPAGHGGGWRGAGRGGPDHGPDHDGRAGRRRRCPRPAVGGDDRGSG